MRRYWIEKSQISHNSSESVNSDSNNVIFKNDQFHHIFSVCRQEVGHHFEVITEDSKAYLVEVTAIHKKSAEAKIIEERIIQNLPKPHIHLALSIPRYPVMDSIVERAVEMGVTSIIPFCSEYSFIRKPNQLPDGKYDRWSKIIISATQQCGRGELLKIKEISTWQEMLQLINPQTNLNDRNWCLFAYEGKTIVDIQKYLILKKQSEAVFPENIWIIVGSEGGFSENEVLQMKQLGLDPVTLGQQILRVETACLTLVSVLKYEFGLLRSNLNTQ